jgi:hypothetical protein
VDDEEVGVITHVNNYLPLIKSAFSMLRKIIILFITLFALQSCVINDKISFQYPNITSYQEIKIEKSGDGSDTLLLLFNQEYKLQEFGYLENNFRTGTWVYASTSGIDSIVWAKYNNKEIDFETNVFQKVDSVNYNEGFVNFKIPAPKGQIIRLTLEVIDTIPTNYKSFTEIELKTFNYILDQYKSYYFVCGTDSIHIFQYSAYSSANKSDITNVLTGTKRLKNNLFLQVTVSSIQNTVFNEILFNGVLTHTKWRGMKIYDPYCLSNE